MAEKSQIIKSASKGYSYNYASLADIAMQGHQIPKMRVGIYNEKEYIEYFDGKEWQLGARIIPLNNKQNNEAQNYGASLSYARRYTALLALQLASSDDNLVDLDTTKIEETLAGAMTLDQLNEIYQTIPDRYKGMLKPAFSKRKQELESNHKAIVEANKEA